MTTRPKLRQLFLISALVVFLSCPRSFASTVTAPCAVEYPQFAPARRSARTRVPANETRSVSPATTQQERDLADLHQIHQESKRALESRNFETTKAALMAAYESQGAEAAVYSPQILMGMGPAAVRYYLALARENPELARQTLVLAKGESGVYGVVGTKTGGDTTTWKNQDARVFGVDTEVPLDQLKGESFGDARGNNEVIAPATLLHLAGTAHQLRMGSTVGSIEYRETAPDGGKSWAHPEAAARVAMTQELSPEFVQKLKQSLGAKYDGWLKAMRERGFVHESEVPGGLVFNQFVYTEGGVIAAGVPSPNVFIGSEGNPFQRLAKHFYDYLNASRGETFHSPPIVSFGDVYKDLVFEEAANQRPADTGVAGAGDTTFVKLQKDRDRWKRQGELKRLTEGKSPAEKQEIERKYLNDHMDSSTVFGLFATLQPKNTQALFDTSGPYFYKTHFRRVGEITDARIIDGHGDPMPIELKRKDGKFKSPSELDAELKARNAKVEVTIKDPQEIKDLGDLAAFFRLTEDQFIAGGYLPSEYFTNGKLNTKKVTALVKQMFQSNGAGNTITFDTLNISQGYNAEELFGKIMSHEGNTPVFENLYQKGVSPLIGPEDETLIGRVSTGVRDRRGKITPVAAHFYTAGALNGLVGDNYLASGSKRGTENQLIVDANRAHEGNVSPLGMQNNMTQVGALGERVAATTTVHAGTTSSADLLANQVRLNNPGGGIRFYLGDRSMDVTAPDSAVVGRPDDTHLGSTGSIVKETPLLQNAFFSEILSKLWFENQAGKSVSVTFEINQNGELTLITKGILVGEHQTLAKALSTKLQRNRNLTNRIDALVRAQGGRLDLTFSSFKDGLVNNASVHFETPMEMVAQMAEENARSGGQKQLTKEVPQLIGRLEPIRIPLHVNEAGLLPEVGARADAIKAKLLEKLGDLKIPGGYLDDPVDANGGTERLYLLRHEKGGPVTGAVIVATGKTSDITRPVSGQSLARIFNYMRGFKAAQDLGVLGPEVKAMGRVENQFDYREHPTIVAFVKVPQGPDMAHLKESQKFQAAEAFGSALADTLSRGAQREISETNNPARMAERMKEFYQGLKTKFDNEQSTLRKKIDRLEVTHPELAQALQTEKNRSAELAEVPPIVLTDPFYQGLLLGATTPDKVFFSERPNGSLGVVFSNYYETKGWGNVMRNVAKFVRGQPPEIQDRVITTFVEGRRSVLGTERFAGLHPPARPEGERNQASPPLLREDRRDRGINQIRRFAQWELAGTCSP